MRIGIDISQAVYAGTGVGKYVRELIPRLIKMAPQHEFVLFAGTLRQKQSIQKLLRSIQKISPNVEVVIMPLPPTFLDFLWNTLHIFPITWFIGHVDVFWSSDWTQPPLGNAVGMTTIHDVSFLHFPESFHKKIVSVQRRRLLHALQECSVFLCDSEATKRDVEEYIGIKKNKLFVVYPGYSKTV